MTDPDDTSTWVTSHRLAQFLAGRRDNDVKVLVNNIGVPIASMAYNSVGDQIEITLVDGDDLRVALSPDLDDEAAPA